MMCTITSLLRWILTQNTRRHLFTERILSLRLNSLRFMNECHLSSPTCPVLVPTPRISPLQYFIAVTSGISLEPLKQAI
jgi:hypothetical protein